MPLRLQWIKNWNAMQNLKKKKKRKDTWNTLEFDNQMDKSSKFNVLFINLPACFANDFFPPTHLPTLCSFKFSHCYYYFHFSDSYTLEYNNNKNTTQVQLIKTGIAWKSDKMVKFSNPSASCKSFIMSFTLSHSCCFLSQHFNC